MVANASFLGCSELGFRWCLAFSHALPMRLRFLSSDCAALSFSFNGFEADVSDPCGRAANASFLGLSELGFRWCLAFSHALPNKPFKSISFEIYRFKKFNSFVEN